MQFYVYAGFNPLGKEGLGTEGKSIWRDLKTIRGALRRAQRQYPQGFRLYQFINFYDDKTFKEVTWPQRWE
jgi:hypothetical protein